MSFRCCVSLSVRLRAKLLVNECDQTAEIPHLDNWIVVFVVVYVVVKYLNE